MRMSLVRFFYEEYYKDDIVNLGGFEPGFEYHPGTLLLNGLCKFLSFVIQDQVLIQGDSFHIFCTVYLMLIIIISCSDSEKKEDVGDKRAE